MIFTVEEAANILARTPSIINAQLSGISDEWVRCNEGENTWSPFDVLGHLIECEETNFLARVLYILSDSRQKSLTPLDMKSHLEKNKDKKIGALIAQFQVLREQNLLTLKSLKLSMNDLQRTALHPTIGIVTVENILATWVGHDLTHLSQINRVVAKQYKTAIGPFIFYLPKLN
jgi:hypothetical protein